MSSTNWCEECQETSRDHPTICSVCGTTLTAAPTTEDNTVHASERLLSDMQEASRNLEEILGNLRGQVQDLDALTSNILQEETNNRGIWDPQEGGPKSRPTSKEALKKIPRFVLNDQSTLFRQAILKVSPRVDPICALSTAPVVPGMDNDEHQRTSVVTAKTNATKQQQHAQNFDCVLGEFGPAGEFGFDMGTTSLVLASPITGKGGLDAETKLRISRLKASTRVVLFMQRGDGLTYVQKARMAQDSGASAAIIANNTPSPWPYVMKDSKGESKRTGNSITIPVAMVKELDGKEIIKLFERQNTEALQQQQQHQPQDDRPPIPKQIVLANENNDVPEMDLQPSQSMNTEASDQDMVSSDHHDARLSCALTITAQSCDCPVCCEQLQNSETVVQLPGCGHVFHEECALHWLKAHNTCPYCRRELPTDDPEYERERRQREQQQQQQRNGDTNAVSGNGASFYG